MKLRTTLLFSIVALVIFKMAVSGVPAASPTAARIEWQRDIFAAHQISQRTGKPILLVFGAEWCTFCKKLEKETLGHRQMAHYVNSSFVPVHIDFDREKRIAGILKVEKIPCTVVLSPEADLLGKKYGYYKPLEYYNVLQDAHHLQRKIQQAGMTQPAPRR